MEEFPMLHRAESIGLRSLYRMRPLGQRSLVRGLLAARRLDLATASQAGFRRPSVVVIPAESALEVVGRGERVDKTRRCWGWVPVAADDLTGVESLEGDSMQGEDVVAVGGAEGPAEAQLVSGGVHMAFERDARVAGLGERDG